MPELTPQELTTLARYFAGQCSAAESQRVAQWIAADPVRQADIEAQRAEWAASGFLVDADRVDALWRRLENRMPAPSRVSRMVRGPAVWRVAASIALAIGGAGLWWTIGQRGPAEVTQVAAASARVVSTPRGQRAELRLPDGTKVLLGPASTMRYAVAADRGARSVTLEGSAYFEVTHDATRPFVVHTPHGSAEDLGTRFTVQAYAADSVLDVVVTEGRVALRAARDSAAAPANDLVLAPGDFGRAAPDGRTTVRHGVAVQRYLAWTEGRLVFEETPLADAVAQIGRWYDLDVRLADPALGRKLLTASFRDESAAEVLRLVAASAGVRLERRDKLVTIHAR